MELEKERGMVFYEAHVMKADGSHLKIVVDADGKLFKLFREE